MEYYLEYGEMQNLKHFLSTGNYQAMRQMIHDVEMRNYHLKLAQARMIDNYKYGSDVNE
jgi:hypothetical protein